MRAVLDRYDALNAVFLGVGLPSRDHPIIVAATAARGRPSIPRGAVATVGPLFFDAQGRPCCSLLDRRTLGMSCAQLKAVPVRVGLAAGAAKAEAVLALVRGGVVDVLVVDTPLAGRLGHLIDTGGRRAR